MAPQVPLRQLLSRSWCREHLHGYTANQVRARARVRVRIRVRVRVRVRALGKE